MVIKSFTEAEGALRPFIPNIRQTNWTFALEDMKALLRELGDPQETFKTIHVAGTSGKTSTSYYIAKMLQLSGSKVGLTVSPHVDSLNERVQIDGELLSEGEFCELLNEFMELPAVDRASPSYFGLLVAFAFWVFAKKRVEYAVVEVGMGGRLDATNTTMRTDKVAVITDIGLDHTDMLGDTIEAIAGEKAGIIHESNQAFSARQAPGAALVIEQTCQQQNAQLHVLAQQAIDKAPDYLPLYQRRNWALAREVVEYVIERDRLSELSEATWKESAQAQAPGRMELFRIGDKTIITDGAHNEQKVAALVASVQAQYPDVRIAGLVSFVQGKDTQVDASMQHLAKILNMLIVTEFNVAQDAYRQAIAGETLEASAQRAGIETKVIADNAQALDALLQRPEPVLLITGSLYLLSQVRPLLKERVQ